MSQQSINTIRMLAVDAVEKANSGHPGLPMGAAPMAYVLWTHFLKHNPSDPTWWDRDRFVLSAGHGSMLLYALLHLTGYDLPMEELKRFRQWKSKTPGHPENFQTPGVETTTGPLGQGFATGVGMAIAEKYLAAIFNRPGFEIIDHHTYGIVSDGDLMEGVASEAASLAGHLGLGKLIYFYDSNGISIDGSTDLTFTEDVGGRFEAYDWHVRHVDDGTDLEAIAEALDAARSEAGRPSLIIVRTEIGYGSPNKAGTASVHGSPLGADEVKLTKEALGWPLEPTFLVPDEVRDHMRRALDVGAEAQREWRERWEAYRTNHADLADKLDAWMAGALPDGWEKHLPVFEGGSSLASRASSHKVINALAPVIDNLIGGSADLTGSNKTDIKGRGDFQRQSPGEGYLRYGVREHAMAAASNGIVLHGGLRPYCGTFLIFSDYMRPSVRLSALMRQPVIYVFTHDSIGQGEDGPTHQPIEHLMSLRAMPNMTLIRPADANEVAQAWRAAILRPNGPTALVLSRQDLPTLDRTDLAAADGLLHGAYVLKDSEGTPDLILIGTGSEVYLLLDASNLLAGDGIKARVVSMPSWELFEEQPEAYRNSVFPPDVKKRLSVEAGATLGWERYLGDEGKALGLDRFGESAPGEVIFEKLGFTAENIAEKARALLG